MLGLALSLSIGSGSPSGFAYDYLVHDDDELDDALTAATAGNVTIALASDGVFAQGRTITKALTSSGRLTLRGSSASSRALIPDLIIAGTSKRITLHSLDFGRDDDEGTCLSLSTAGGVPEDVIVHNCDCSGWLADPYGQYAAGTPTTRRGITGGFKNLIITESFFLSLLEGIKLQDQQGSFYCDGNYFDLYGEDAISLGYTVDSTRYTITNNFMCRPFLKGSDVGNPHADGIQLTFSTGLLVAPDLEISGNIKYQGDARAAGQTIYFTSHATSKWLGARVRDNYGIIGDPSGYAGDGSHDAGNQSADTKIPDGGFCSSGYFARNFAIWANPGETHVALPSGAVNNFTGDPPSILCDSVGALSAPGGTLTNNFTIADDLTAYLANFDGIGGSFTGFPRTYGSRANLIALKSYVVAAFKPKAGGPLDALRDVYDYATGVRNGALTRVYVAIENQINQTTSTDYETGWLPISGGGTSITVTPQAGTSWKVADDASGTNPTAYSPSAGTTIEGKYMKLKRTTSASANTTVTYGVTLNSNVYSMNLTTASATPYDDVENAVTAWSLISDAPTSAASQKIMYLSFEVKFDTSSNGKGIFGNSTAGQNLQLVPSAGKIKLQIGSSSTCNVLSDAAVSVGTWQRHIVILDLTPEAAAGGVTSVLQWYIDGILQTWTGSPSVTGSASFNPATVFGGFVMFATGQTAGTPANLGDGGFRYLWCDYGDASYSKPSEASPSALNNLFAADSIDLTDGSGPTGSPPKIFLQGTAAEWNAGTIANKGSGGAFTMAKQAGTYA